MQLDDAEVQARKKGDRERLTAEAKRRKENPVPWFEIEVSLGNDNEPRDIYVGGMEEGDMRITRGKAVIVPLTVLQRLDDAVLGVSEPDEKDETKQVIVARKRFPYTVLREVQNHRKAA